MNLLVSFPGTSGWVFIAFFVGIAAWLWYDTIPQLHQHRFQNPFWKIVWVIVIFAWPVIGALLYKLVYPKIVAVDAEIKTMGICNRMSTKNAFS